MERIVKDLRTLQIRFSFDDFGTGNTSLRYLTKILPDELKIDRSFVQDDFSRLIAKKSKIQVVNIRNQNELKNFFKKDLYRVIDYLN